MIKHQIGSFSWEAGLIRSQLRPGNWALIRLILCFFTPHANEIQRADQFAQGQLHTDRRIGWLAKKSDSPKMAGVSHKPSSAVREMSDMERPLLASFADIWCGR
jgi:hypothetical protein